MKANIHTGQKKITWPTKIERTNIFTGETTTLVLVQVINGKSEYRNTATNAIVKGIPHNEVKE